MALIDHIAYWVLIEVSSFLFGILCGYGSRLLEEAEFVAEWRLGFGSIFGHLRVVLENPDDYVIFK
eukprot:CAMPEP_0178995660 /NCGR_PEP_ID=MMETSP0795-20121207/7939_1 /TAXON_ID=88552 /ORGANISM="Amoebophrya sp., Strain Ameob2" /LENGTH=65 /DNA_ID=CAMNT_0020687969 /DNA_START=330 /DNA_END=527 /DNA_ORIENTATION=-